MYEARGLECASLSDWSACGLCVHGVPMGKGNSTTLNSTKGVRPFGFNEANRSESRDDFVHKVAIAVKEANESCYWFKVLTGLCGSSERLEALSKETSELRNLLQSILKSARSH